MSKSNVGVIGMAVMGSNLARNIAGKGYKTSVYNRERSVTESFLNKYGTPNLIGTYELQEFVDSIEKPRKIIIMIAAGKPVDEVISKLTPLLDKGDIIIDCGNSFYKDTQRRYELLSGMGLNFIGCGVSGGEEGALNGPSIMPGGNIESYNKISDILKNIAASDFHGGKCVTYIGENGAGHYVKMVHNGIEYAIMQMITEAYDSLRKIYNMNPQEISEVFKKYNEGKLNSYLFEITGKVLEKKDEFNKNDYLIDKILDKAGAKGTGKWTSVEGLDRAESVSTIVEATFSRAISTKKELRKELSKKYNLEQSGTKYSIQEYTKLLENALYISMLIAYSQGYSLILQASRDENWNINLSEISRIWQGGCIIRAQLLDFLSKTFANSKQFEHLLELDEIRNEIIKNIDDYKKVVMVNMDNNIPMPALGAGINYFYAMTQECTGANLIQGLRDYFGAHTYERNDREGIFHTNW